MILPVGGRSHSGSRRAPRDREHERAHQARDARISGIAIAPITVAAGRARARHREAIRMPEAHDAVHDAHQRASSQGCIGGESDHTRRHREQSRGDATTSEPRCVEQAAVDVAAERSDPITKVAPPRRRAS